MLVIFDLRHLYGLVEKQVNCIRITYYICIQLMSVLNLHYCPQQIAMHVHDEMRKLYEEVNTLNVYTIVMVNMWHLSITWSAL